MQGWPTHLYDRMDESKAAAAPPGLPAAMVEMITRVKNQSRLLPIDRRCVRQHGRDRLRGWWRPWLMRALEQTCLHGTEGDITVENQLNGLYQKVQLQRS